MGLRHVLLMLALATLGLATGCGEEPAPAPPADKPPVDAGPTVPLHGLVIIVPSRAAERVGPEIGFDALSEVERSMTGDDWAGEVVVQRGEDFGQPGRLRFFLQPDPERSDEAADAQASEHYGFIAVALNMAFRMKLSEALNSSVHHQAAQRQNVTEAQSAYSAYLATRRGIPDTPESRREKARLDHALETANAALLEATEDLDRLQEVVDADPAAIRRVR